MLIAAVSDSHDHREGLAAAVERAKAAGAEALFHLGDLVAPFMLQVLAAFPGAIHLAIGNNDGDRLTLSRLIPRVCPQVEDFGEMVAADLGGFRAAGVHDPRFARGLASTGEYDLVLFGHTHQPSLARVGSCLLVNPGELYGLHGSRTMCLIDTATREVERVIL